MKTIEIKAAQYADSDDCLAAAERDYAEAHDLEGWDLSPRWADDERETILLSVPAATIAVHEAEGGANVGGGDAIEDSDV